MAELMLMNVTVQFGSAVALRDISLNVEQGEYLVILGPTGAGKTTLLKTIAGLYQPQEGQITLRGSNITELNPEERHIAYLPQTYALFPRMTVWENISYSQKLQSKEEKQIQELTREILNMVHLSDRPDAYPRELSGGMKQRTALGRSLATNFPVLLLDEPLRALDARLRLELRLELKKLAQDLGFTVLHVTHDQEEAMSVADRILVLNNGRILQVGTQEEIYFHPTNIFVASFLGEVNKAKALVHSSKFDKSDLEERQEGEERSSHRYLLVDEFGLSHAVLSEKRFTQGEKVLVVVRSENIRLSRVRNGNGRTFDEDSKKGKVKVNKYLGKVVEKQFLGKWINIHVEVYISLENEEMSKPVTHWVVKAPIFLARRYDVGAKVVLRVKREGIILFHLSEEEV